MEIFNPVVASRYRKTISTPLQSEGSMELSRDSEEKRLNRREILEKKKAIDRIIKAASSQHDHLVSFPSFRCFNRNGLCVRLESGRGDKLSLYMKQCIQHLLKVNMEKPYGLEWATEERVKRREMVAPEARYIFVFLNANESMEVNAASPNPSRSPGSGPNPLLGFVHYRFTLEEEVPVLYLYEIQLDSSVQGKGLGEFLMQLIELIARKNCMGAMVLTVQKANSSAMKFYISKLRYVISRISPSKVDPMAGDGKNYEILCKTFDLEAKAVLEMNNIFTEDTDLNGAVVEDIKHDMKGLRWCTQVNREANNVTDVLAKYGYII